MLEEHGAVSAEVAGAMAEGARTVTRSDFALAVTGVAGPEGGSDEKPVGLVYVACAGPHGASVTRGQYPGDRASVREFSGTAALHLLHDALGR